MSNDNWDYFPSNLGEIKGPIERAAFDFNYSRIEVWHAGQCIFNCNSDNWIRTQLKNGTLHVKLSDSNLNDYVIPEFSFGEISTNLDRIMWSKDIFNQTNQVERSNPDIASLFYQNGQLSKVTFTIHNPNILIEFYQ